MGNRTSALRLLLWKLMLLLTGPPGSGLSAEVLRQFRDLLLRGATDIRLLVPTATMAEHLRNLLAREGFVVRPNLILTLSQFVAPSVEDIPQVTKPALYLLVEKVVKNLRLPDFEKVADKPGFITALTQVIEELSTAGCDHARLAQSLPETPFGQAVVAVFTAVEDELFRRGWGMRSARLLWAARRIESDGLPGIRAIWMDGFFAFTEPELAVIAALNKHAKVTVTLPDAQGREHARDALLRMGAVRQTFPAVAALPQISVFRAPTGPHETDEISRRILAEAGAGCAFRDIGIVVRTPETYLPVLRASLERFGIPARFYFSETLADHAIPRFFSGVVRAMLSHWDYEQTLAAIRLLNETRATDRFDFEVREKLPGKGLEGLRAVAGENPVLSRLLDSFASMEPWRDQSNHPGAWAQRLKSLRALVSTPRPPEAPSREQSELWLGQARALRLRRRPR
jgi:ATP-dependent helicase/DNAse subunit B